MDENEALKIQVYESYYQGRQKSHHRYLSLFDELRGKKRRKAGSSPWKFPAVEPPVLKSDTYDRTSFSVKSHHPTSISTSV